MKPISAGEAGDAVIICGSTVKQVKVDVDACLDDTPLPQVIAKDPWFGYSS